MKKKFFSLLLMLVVGILSSSATVSVGTSENTSGWWTYFSDYYTMTANQKAHITFKNCNAGTGGNYNNWILAVTSDAERSATGYEEYLILRNDNYGWGNYYNPVGLSNNFNFDGTTFVTDMNNATVNMYITFDDGRINMTSTITTEGGTVYNYSCKTLCVPTKDKYRFFFTVDASHIEDLTVSYEDYTPTTSMKAISTTTTETVGNTDKSNGWWTAFSPYYTVKDGQMAVVTFTDYIGTATYQNWTWVAHTQGTKRAGDGYSEYMVLRSDGYGWNSAGNTNSSDATVLSKIYYAKNNDFVWGTDNATFISDRNGATVQLKVYPSNGYIVMQETTTNTSSTSYHQNYVSPYESGMTGFTFFLTPESSYLSNVTTTIYQNAYTLTYHNNGHGTAPETSTEAVLPNPLPTMTEDGYTFDGWFTDEALTTAAVAGADITTATDLYAKWTHVVYERGTFTAWSSTDVTTTSGTENAWYSKTFTIDSTNGLYQAAASGSRSAVLTYAPTTGSIQTIDLVFSNLGNTGSSSDYSYLKIGSGIEIQSNQQDQTGYVIINGNSYTINDCNIRNFNRGGDLWTIHAEINTATNTLNALTILGNAVTVSLTTHQANFTLSAATNLGNATYNTITIGTNRSKGSPAVALKSIEITEVIQTLHTATFTESTGLTPTVTIYTDEKKTSKASNGVLVNGAYYYTATLGASSAYLDYTGSFTVDGDNPTVDFTMELKPTYTLSVNAVDASSNDLGEIATVADAYDGKAVTIGCPMYLTDDNHKVTYKISGSISTTLTSSSTGCNVLYTAYEGTAYFVEAEKVISCKGLGTYTDTRLSNGQGVYGGRFATITQTAMKVPESGTYTITYGAFTRNVGQDGYFKFYEGDDLVATSDNVKNSINYYGTFSNSEVCLTKDKSLKVMATSTNLVLDYILLTKVGDYIYGEKVGALDYSTVYFTTWNKTAVQINAGETGYYKFINHNNGGATYENWYLYAANTSSVNLTILRADNWANVGGGTISSFPETSDLVSDLNGATVELKVSLANAGDGTYTLTSTAEITKADGTKMSPNYVYTQTGFTVSTLNLYVSVEKNWIDVLSQGIISANRSTKEGKYGTICMPCNFTATGANLYTIYKFSTDGVITLQEAGTTGTAGIPYIYNATTKDNSQTFAYSDLTLVTTPSDGDNGLTGCFEATYVPAGSYVMQTLNNRQGFYQVENANTIQCGANKCYLNYTKGGSVRAFYLDGEGEETAISTVNALLNGDNKIYDLSGRQLQHLQKGINIVNGKKIIVK